MSTRGRGKKAAAGDPKPPRSSRASSKGPRGKAAKKGKKHEEEVAPDPFAFHEEDSDAGEEAALAAAKGKNKKKRAAAATSSTSGSKEKANKKRATKQQKKASQGEQAAEEEEEEKPKPKPKRVARKSARGAKKRQVEEQQEEEEAKRVETEASKGEERDDGQEGGQQQQQKEAEEQVKEEEEEVEQKETNGGEDQLADPDPEMKTEDVVERRGAEAEAEAAALKKLTVPQLRKKLKQCRLSTQGKKQELIDRYFAHANRPQAQPSPVADSTVAEVVDTAQVGQDAAAAELDRLAAEAPASTGKDETASEDSNPARPEEDHEKAGTPAAAVEERETEAGATEGSQAKKSNDDTKGEKELSTVEKTATPPQQKSKTKRKVKEATKKVKLTKKKEEENKKEEEEELREDSTEKRKGDDEALAPAPRPTATEDEAAAIPEPPLLEVIVPNSLPASQDAETDAQMEATTAEDTSTETQLEREERKRRRKESLLAEEIERVHRERVETEKRLREMTDRESRLKRRQAERKERIKKKAESTPTRKAANKAVGKKQLAPRALDAEDDAWMINSSPLDLAEGSFGGAATVEPTSPTTIDAEVREASAEEETGKPTTEPTKTTKTVENVASPRKRGRQEVDELHTSPAKPTKKRRKKEGHDKPSEAGEKEEVAPEENGEKRRKTAQDEELREQEETLARRLAELDDERQRVKEELERVKSQREQLRADLDTTPTTKTAKPKRKSAKKERKGKEEADSTTHAENGNAEPENGAKRSKRKREDKKEEQEEEVAAKKPEEPKTKAKTKRRKKADNAADPVEEKSTNAEDEIVDIEGDGGEVKGKEKEKEATAVVPAKASFKWRAGFVSITGGRPENQDAYIVPLSAVPVAAPSAATSRRSRGRKSAPVIVEEMPALSLPALPSPNDDLAIFGVLDGHGLKGQYAAQAGSKYLHTFIAQSLSDLQQDDMAEGGTTDPLELVKAAIQAGIRQTQEVLLQDGQESGIEYGTTAVVCVQIGASLIVGNVGDSRAVLFRSPKSAVGIGLGIELESVVATGRGRGRGSRRRATLELADPQLTEVMCTHDHRPWRKEEAERVAQESNGRGRVTVGSDGKTLRVFPSFDYYSLDEIRAKKLGLAMTRSLGHAILSTCGVSSEPEFFCATLQDGDKLIIGCDGLWDVLTNTEAMKIVSLYAGQDPQAACAALVSEAERRWEQKSSGGDNITAVVVFFNTT